MSVLLDLNPQGQWIIGLPHEDGSHLWVTLSHGQVLERAKKVLIAQKEGLSRKVGFDSAPTQHQVDEWLKQHRATLAIDALKRGAIKKSFDRLSPEEKEELLRALEASAERA